MEPFWADDLTPSGEPLLGSPRPERSRGQNPEHQVHPGAAFAGAVKNCQVKRKFHASAPHTAPQRVPPCVTGLTSVPSDVSPALGRPSWDARTASGASEKQRWIRSLSANSGDTMSPAPGPQHAVGSRRPPTALLAAATNPAQHIPWFWIKFRVGAHASGGDHVKAPT
jgi:hypothetical protein